MSFHIEKADFDKYNKRTIKRFEPKKEKKRELTYLEEMDKFDANKDRYLNRE